MDISKSQKKAVHKLLGEAHEAEIAKALLDVEAAIQKWRDGKILPSQVGDRIHEFHKENQEIFKAYNAGNPMLALARAVFYEFIPLDRVPEDLRPRVKELQTLFDR